MSAGSHVVTLTAAGAIDATYRVGAVRPGSFTRATSYEREMSGKGVNVSAALDRGGRPTTAVVVIGSDDLEFAERTDSAGLLRTITVPGATRVNTSIIDDAGSTTKVNAPTPALAPEVWDQVVATTLEELDLHHAGWLVVSGTIPSIVGSSCPADLAVLLDGARQRGVLVAMDSSGPALARAADDPAGLALLKPNADELAELTGRSLHTLGDVADAARQLTDRGIGAVFASLGADGVLVVTADAIIHAYATAPRLANTAGAGDASLAGFLSGLGAGALSDPTVLRAAAYAAASWGAHAVAQESTILPDLRDLPVATLTVEPDPRTALSEPAIVG
jgi:1-phosphofructokinase